MTLYLIATAILLASWVAFVIVFVVAGRKVPKARESNPDAEVGVRKDPLANWGILLQGLAFFMTFVRKWEIVEVPAAALIAGMIILPSAVLFAAVAVRHLGVQWRVQAVVSQAHRLIRTGPYAVIRHPIYASMFGLLVGSGLILWRWQSLLVAIVVFVIGTEIRVRAEDGLLDDRFGPEFRDYRTRVKAWIPFIR
jgi:protein-S-isoprenylcysteine O-methyltransferase Ste14